MVRGKQFDINVHINQGKIFTQNDQGNIYTTTIKEDNTNLFFVAIKLNQKFPLRL